MTAVQPLGRGATMNAAQAAELAALAQYREALRAAGPVGGDAAALAHRNASLEYDRALDSMNFLGRNNREAQARKTFTECGLSVTF